VEVWWAAYASWRVERGQDPTVATGLHAALVAVNGFKELVSNQTQGPLQGTSHRQRAERKRVE
jgi:hypothetical protein